MSEGCDRVTLVLHTVRGRDKGSVREYSRPVRNALRIGLLLLLVGGWGVAAGGVWPRRMLEDVVCPPPSLPPPVPVQPTPPPVCTPSDGVDSVVLPYDGDGRGLHLTVQAQAQAAEIEVPLLFDTGATLTTLDRATLRRLGVEVPADAPVLEVRTANGPARVPIALVPRMWVGGLEVGGVTVGVCEPCADEQSRGLMGLNVTGRFLVTVDTVRRELTFQPRTDASDRLLDVSPWLDVDASLQGRGLRGVHATLTVRNRATRAVRDATARLSCADGGERTWDVPLGSVDARATVTREMPLDDPDDCRAWRVRLHAARW